MSVNKVQEEELHVIPKLWVSGVEHPPSGRVQALSPAPWEVSNRGGGHGGRQWKVRWQKWKGMLGKGWTKPRIWGSVLQATGGTEVIF